MSKKTRYFVLTAATILTVGLTTGLVASYMGMGVAFSKAAGPDELQYVPADAAVVAYANVRDVMNSNFRERFRKLEPDTQERDEFQQKTGVNIEEDINSVVAAMIPGAGNVVVAPGGPEGASEGGVLILARGRFEQSRLEALALEHGGKAEEYGGKRLLTHVKDSGDPDMAVGFLEADLIALGSYSAIKKSIDAGRGNNIVSNTELMRQVNELDGSNAWAVGRFDAIAKSAHLPSELQAQIPTIQWFSAAGHVNGGLSGVVKAEAKDDASGQNLRDMIRGFLALAKMQAGSKPEMKAMVDALQLSGEGKSVTLSFEVPSEIFDVLEQMGAQHLKR
ncbi:MAG TPA: hypothetical protein VNJ02_15550 [Vicinamibacterales bacterium]|nr:hypothetical protein [Vicinamibacterales bacterium]